MSTAPKIDWEAVYATIENKHIDWREFFDDRQLKEIAFSELYAADFAHGTDGHNGKMIIAQMAKLLDTITANVAFEGDSK